MSRLIGSHPSDSPPPAEAVDGTFQTSGVVTIAGGHSVHDTFTAWLAPMLPLFIEKMSLSNAAASATSPIGPRCGGWWCWAPG